MQQEQELLIHPYKIIKWLHNPRLITVEIHPSYRCNYQCEWCIDKTLRDIGPNADKKTILKPDRFMELADELKELDVQGVTFSGGGDPFLNISIIPFISKCGKLGIKTGGFTNGSNFSEAWAETVLENMLFLRFSLDHSDPEKYARTKKVPIHFFHSVLGKIKYLCNQKKAHHSCKVAIDYVITPDTVNEIDAAIRLAETLGVDYIQFAPVVTFDKVDVMRSVTVTLRQEIEERISNLTSSVQIIVVPLQQKNETHCQNCQMLNFTCLIGADGTVRPCMHLARHDEIAYGNIYEKSFVDIWNNRPKQINTDFYYEPCRCREYNKILRDYSKLNHLELL